MYVGDLSLEMNKIDSRILYFYFVFEITSSIIKKIRIRKN